MTRFLVLLDGPCQPTALLRERAAGLRAVAADGGLRHAAPLGVAPELWVGDFDGADPALPSQWPDLPREAYPVAKDMTDGEIAMRAALARGARELVVAGALGGPRLDHALGTVMLAVSLAGEGTAVTLTDGVQWVRPLLPGRALRPHPREGPLLSVVALDALAGLTLEGVRWPLGGAAAGPGASRTLSNRMTEGAEPAVRLAGGRALVVTGPADGPARPKGVLE